MHTPPPLCLCRGRLSPLSEHRAVGGSRHCLHIFCNPSIPTSSSSASKNASELGSIKGGFDLETPGGTSPPQTKATRVSERSSARLPLPLLRAHEGSTPEQKEEVGARTTEGFVGAAAAVALAEASGEQSAAPLSPGELTTGTESPLAPTFPGAAITTKSVAAAAVVATGHRAASPAWSPSREDGDLQKTSAVGAGVAAAMLSSVSETRCQRGHSRPFKSPQPEPQSEPQPPALSTPSQQASGARTANEVQPLRFRRTVDGGTERKGQDRSSTTNEPSTLVAAAAAERLERETVAVAATANEKLEVEAVHHDQNALSNADPTSSKNHTVDRMAAAVAMVSEKNRRHRRGAFNVQGVKASGAVGPLGPRAASTGMRLWPGLAAVQRARLPPNATGGPMDGDGSFRASFTERRGVSDSCLPRGEDHMETNARMDAEATNEAWERVMRGGAHREFDAKDEATGIAMLSKGRSPRRAKPGGRWMEPLR